jgi:hypothetical protein
MADKQGSKNKIDQPVEISDARIRKAIKEGIRRGNGRSGHRVTKKREDKKDG